MYGAIVKVAVVYGGAFIIGLALVSFPASSAFLKTTHGFSDQQYGAIFLPQLLMAITGAIAAAYVVRKIRLQDMYRCALLALFVSQVFLLISFYLAPSAALICIMSATACFGFGFGFGGGPLNALACLLFPAKSGSALTAFHMLAGVGLMSGPLLFRGAIAGGQWIWAPFLLAGIAIVLFIMTFLTVLPEATGRPDDASVSPPLRSVYFYLMLVIAIIYAFAEGTFSNWAIIYLSESKQLSPTVAASGLSFFWGGLTLGRLLVSFLLLKMEALMIWVISVLLMLPAFILVANIDSGNEAMLAFAFAGLACSAFFPLMVTLASEPYPQSVSWIASMLTAALMLGVGVGSSMIGSLKNSMALEDIYLYSGIYPLMALALIGFSIRFRRQT